MNKSEKRTAPQTDAASEVRASPGQQLRKGGPSILGD